MVHKLKKLLAEDTFLPREQMEQFVTEIVQNEEFENLTLSNDCKEVIVNISGYITHSVVANTKYRECLDCLQKILKYSASRVLTEGDLTKRHNP